MINILSKSTKQLERHEKKKILLLKDEFWKKGYKSQSMWFKKNIFYFDIHNLLFVKTKLAGYTCLRLRKLQVKNRILKYLLLDTIIISKKFKNKGLGSLLMLYNNKIIISKRLPSFLVCEKKNINFYKKNYWFLLKKKDFLVSDENYTSKFGMIFNIKFKNKLNIWVNK